MATLSLRHIDKTYDNNVQAVFDFNLDIKDKEFIVFVGPSGCGKSTTLRMIAGLEDVSTGDLIINGKRVNNVAPKDRDIAMVFQSYALYPHMNVYKNMAFDQVVVMFLYTEQIVWPCSNLGIQLAEFGKTSICAERILQIVERKKNCIFLLGL